MARRTSGNTHVARVLLWGEQVGAVAMEGASIGRFEYDPAFVRRGLDVAPLMMPLEARRIYSFPELNPETFMGLPGLLADSLPDKYGNELIDLWLRRQGRDVSSFSPVERLCYVGARGMGALEFKPAITDSGGRSSAIDIGELADLAAQIMRQRERLRVDLTGDQSKALNTIIQVGTSAGGARAKAIVAWNPATGEVRSGQVAAPDGFEPWILKFDGATDEKLGEPEGFGRIEFAYFQMATAAGIEMNECQLLVEGSRAHFMTKRFDRTESGQKIHMQSLCALGHYDFNTPRIYGYETAFEAMRRLNLPQADHQQMYRRMVFNIVARNQDDHTRNIAFLMTPDGQWRLSPAFDVIWAYNPRGMWTSEHQMSVLGKTDGFTLDDLVRFAESQDVLDAREIVNEVVQSVAMWPDFASSAQVDPATIDAIRKTHRLRMPGVDA